MLIATFAGRIGRVQELRQTQAGKAVLGFALAVDDGYGDQKRTLWVDCSLWGKRAEALQPHLSKGMALTVTGKPGIRTYEKDGQTHAVMTLMVNDLTMQGGRQERPPEPRREQPRPAATDSFDDESIPF